jgi:hypothetical protein
VTPLTPEQERAAAALRSLGVDRPTMEQINWAATQPSLPSMTMSYGSFQGVVDGAEALKNATTQTGDGRPPNAIRGVSYGGQTLTPQMRAGLANLGRAVAAALVPATDKPLPPDMRYRGATDAQRKLTKSQRRNRRRRDRQNKKKNR